MLWVVLYLGSGERWWKIPTSQVISVLECRHCTVGCSLFVRKPRLAPGHTASLPALLSPASQGCQDQITWPPILTQVTSRIYEKKDPHKKFLDSSKILPYIGLLFIPKVATKSPFPSLVSFFCKTICLELSVLMRDPYSCIHGILCLGSREKQLCFNPASKHQPTVLCPSKNRQELVVGLRKAFMAKLGETIGFWFWSAMTIWRGFTSCTSQNWLMLL